MTQLTIRADEVLVRRVKAAASELGRSMNDYVTAVLDAATNPESASTDAARLRERLRLAGLLTAPSRLAGQRPNADAIARAGQRAATGRPLADFVGGRPLSVSADSSASVKLYVPEEDHEIVRQLTGPLVISILARVEVPTAFWGKHRAGGLAIEDAALLTTAFEFDYHGDADQESAFVVVPIVESILIDAARRAARHGLRAYDSVQLACAVAARRADPAIDTVAVFDTDLRKALLAEGFSILA